MPRKKTRKTAALASHNVYVVQLCPSVLGIKRFAEANPCHDPSKPCVYVGMTGLPPMERFLNHKKGYKANSLVEQHGTRLLPALFEHLNPMPYEKAKSMEPSLAQALRALGYAVWSK